MEICRAESFPSHWYHFHLSQIVIPHLHSLDQVPQFCSATSKSIVLISNLKHLPTIFASLWLPMEGILWTENAWLKKLFPPKYA